MRKSRISFYTCPPCRKITRCANTLSIEYNKLFKNYAQQLRVKSKSQNKMMVSMQSAWNFIYIRMAPRILLAIILVTFVGYFLIVTLPPVISVTDSMVSRPSVKYVCSQAGSQFDKPIPQHIHQMWKSKDVPDEWKEYVQHCRDLNPGWNYTLWTDDEIDAFIAKEYPWFIETYRNYPYRIQRPDSSRYFLLYHFGGVYIDMDIDCKVPFSTVFKNTTKDTDVVLGATAPLGITNNFMAAKAKHPFLRLLINDLIPAAHGWYVTPHWTVIMSAGPWHVYRTYLKYPCTEHIHIISVQEHKDCFDHEQAATWHSWDGQVMVWLDRHHRPVIFIVFLLLVLFAFSLLRCCFRWLRSQKKSNIHINGTLNNGKSHHLNGKSNVL